MTPHALRIAPLIVLLSLVSFAADELSSPKRVKLLEYDQKEPTDPATWRPVTYQAEAPSGGVTLGDGLFREAMVGNIAYLRHSFTVNDMLYWFRKRAGVADPPLDHALNRFWLTDLKGSCAGRFLMGAGNTLQWIEDPALRQMMDELVAGIGACVEPDGYGLPYPPEEITKSEQGNYARAWLTHGMLDAAAAGNQDALGVIRKSHDWFNQCAYRPQMLLMSLGVQGHIASTRMYFSPAGKPEDLQVAEQYYVLDWWMQRLIARDREAIWKFPLDRPHCYLVTAFEAYLDHYRATGQRRYLEAMTAAWQMYRDHWLHIGGAAAICERREYPPDSRYIDPRMKTGELCGSVFWALFNQRFALLNPAEEKYVAEIERSIYNIVLANACGRRGFRNTSYLEGQKQKPSAFNTCCEGQGTRMVGALPRFIFWTADDGLYVNLYEPSAIDWRSGNRSLRLTMDSRFPYASQVTLTVHAPQPTAMKLRIRVPSWADQPVPIRVDGEVMSAGQPGQYVTLDRTWRDGQKITFDLPMPLRTVRYIGADQIEGHTRYAVMYGPILMAVTAPEVPKHGTIALAHHAAAPTQWLKPVAGEPLHFTIDGRPELRVRPYFEVDNEPFTCFPVID